MSIRRTRQQKMNAELRREEGAIRYEPVKQVGTYTQTQASKQPTSEQKKTSAYFMMDMKKTAVSTLIVLVMLGVTFWLLR